MWVDMMTTAQIATTPATAPSTAYLRALRLCAAPAIGSASDDTMSATLRQKLEALDIDIISLKVNLFLSSNPHEHLRPMATGALEEKRL